MKIKLPETLLEEHGKRTVVLLHAYSGSPNDVHMLFRFLEKADYTVYSPLFKGHGTDDPQNILAQTSTVWYEQSRAAIKQMQEKGHDQVAVFGLSMGGMIAMADLTEQDPVVIGGGSFCSPLFDTRSHVAESFQQYARKILVDAGIAGSALQQKMAKIQADGSKQLADIEAFGQKTAQHLKNVQVPVFLAQAGKDQMIDARSVFATAAALKKTKVTLQWYPESGHVLTVGPEHKQFEKDVLAFLASLPWNEDE